MTQAPARAHIHSSSLTRFLTENAMLDADQVADDVGQQVGDWLNFRQAIALHGVLTPEPTPTLQPRTAQTSRARVLTSEALARHVDKVRSQLVQSITQGAPPGSGLARIEMPPPTLDEPVEPKTAYAPYRRFHAAHQRQMQASLLTLRAQVRGQLAQSAAPMSQLAALDAAFENILSEREALLLGQVAKLLEKRFAQALKQHTQAQAKAKALATDGPNDGPSALARAGVNAANWLTPFAQSLRTALLAELDTRLQPTLGLLEAYQSLTPCTP